MDCVGADGAPTTKCSQSDLKVKPWDHFYLDTLATASEYSGVNETERRKEVRQMRPEAKSFTLIEL